MLDKACKTELLRLDGFSTLLGALYQQAFQKVKPSAKGMVLLASILKLRKQARAVQLLAPEGLMEEIMSINRTMVEVGVNAIYLQSAEDAEYDRYINFDVQSRYVQATKLKDLNPDALSDEQQKEIDEAVAFARSRTNKDRTWSKLSPLQRAENADRRLDVRWLTVLFPTVYLHGNQPVHGTFSSVQPFYSALGTGDVALSQERLRNLMLAIAATNCVLYMFGRYLDVVVDGNLTESFLAVGQIEAE